ncbi:MAG: hypothetical protein JWN14_4247 [Chthonomonadales bacterium]|nr:hypothetical protein [Chthonomonadales bacterium]
MIFNPFTILFFPSSHLRKGDSDDFRDTYGMVRQAIVKIV